MTWDDVSFILRSSLSRKILETLKERSPLTPFQMSKETNIARSNISTKLVELRKRKLVECVNPQSRKWRFYKITDKGNGVLTRAKKIRS